MCYNNYYIGNNGALVCLLLTENYLIGGEMLKIIEDTSLSNELFLKHARNKTNVVFAPSYAYTSTFTVNQYISFGKKDFDIGDFKTILSSFDIDDPEVGMHDLNVEQINLVHYLSYLSVNFDNIYLDLSNLEGSEEYYSKLANMILLFDKQTRNINLICNNQKFLTRLNSGISDGADDNNLFYNSQITPREILRVFLVGRFVVLASLVVSIIIILAMVVVDTEISLGYSNFLNIPNNAILIHNQSSSCDFNQFSYDITTCNEVDPITYEKLVTIATENDVTQMYFDNQYNISKLYNHPNNGEKIYASVPNLNFQFEEELSSLPCINPASSTPYIVCKPYDEETTLISNANSVNITALEENIEFDATAYPDYIYIESDNVKELATKLANAFPNIDIYTALKTEAYITHTYSDFINKTFILGTALSLLFAAGIFLLFEQLGLSIRGLRYFLLYKSRKPVVVKNSFNYIQLIYFITLILFGSVITSNITNSMISLMIGLYLGVLNSALWIILALQLGGKYRDNEIKLNRDIKKMDKLKKD